MDTKKTENKKMNILTGIYRSSMGTSLLAMTVVGMIELVMLFYTIANPALYGPYIVKYRFYYAFLLALAVIYIALSLFVKKDMERRYVLLKIANPICAALFFGWSLVVTYSDAVANGMVDPTVFMTFSSSVPLIFYLFPMVYAVIALISDVVMLYLILMVSGSAAALINIAIFFIFQFVLGMGFLRLKTSLSERIVDERERAEVDAMTGLFNRRAYTDDMEQLAQAPVKSGFVYLSVDVNGLKEVNDNQGHEAGDKLIVGAAQCIKQCFGDFGKLYRVGGDEFAGLLHVSAEKIADLSSDFEKRMKSWSDENGITLTASVGYACSDDQPGSLAENLARIADERMYAAKTEYYRISGKDRRQR